MGGGSRQNDWMEIAQWVRRPGIVPQRALVGVPLARSYLAGPLLNLKKRRDTSAAQGSDLLVLLALADFADEPGKAWPSNATRARKAGVNELTVRRTITKLHDEHKENEVSYNTGQRGVNEYHVLCFARDIEAPEESSPPKNLHPPKPIRGEDSSPPPGNTNESWGAKILRGEEHHAEISPNPPVSVKDTGTVTEPSVPVTPSPGGSARKFPAWRTCSLRAELTPAA
jgi:hypothetical protein